MPDLGQDEALLVLSAIGILLTALGLSTASGLRAYFPLLGVAVGSNLNIVQLSKPFAALGTPGFVILLAVLALGEFAVDKIPGLDHASDLIHTIVRPVAGAVVMAGISTPLSESNPWAAAAVGAVLALSVHGVKAVSRPAVTATTVGLANPVVSLGEDIVTLVMTLLALLAPVLAFIFFVLLVLFVVRPILRGLRRLFGGGRVPQPRTVPSAPVAAPRGASPSATHQMGPPLRSGGHHRTPIWPQNP